MLEIIIPQAAYFRFDVNATMPRHNNDAKDRPQNVMCNFISRFTGGNLWFKVREREKHRAASLAQHPVFGLIDTARFLPQPNNSKTILLYRVVNRNVILRKLSANFVWSAIPDGKSVGISTMARAQ